MPISIRDAKESDARDCGRIIHAAFAAIADQHRFQPDFPSADAGAGLAAMLIAHPAFYGVVAEDAGTIVGSNFLDERSSIGGIGPITVEPSRQNAGTGRRLMRAVMERAAARKMPGVRLVQDAFHNRSLCLYTSLGFVVREPLSVMQGTPPDLEFPGYDVRPATEADLAACNALCRFVHGFDRGREIADGIAQGSATVVEHLGRISGYAVDIGLFAHAVGETNQDLKALIGAAAAFSGPGFIVPTRNHDLFDWCLEKGLRLVKQQTLMTVGFYNEPRGAYLPSVLY